MMAGSCCVTQRDARFIAITGRKRTRDAPSGAPATDVNGYVPTLESPPGSVLVLGGAIGSSRAGGGASGG
jgi:hypothetical protein